MKAEQPRFTAALVLGTQRGLWALVSQGKVSCEVQYVSTASEKEAISPVLRKKVRTENSWLVVINPQGQVVHWADGDHRTPKGYIRWNHVQS